MRLLISGFAQTIHNRLEHLFVAAQSESEFAVIGVPNLLQ